METWRPTSWKRVMGPRSHNLKWKINFFSRFFKNELLLSQNHLIFHCDFCRALFVDLISFRDLFPPGVHCAVSHLLSRDKKEKTARIESGPNLYILCWEYFYFQNKKSKTIGQVFTMKLPKIAYVVSKLTFFRAF